MLKIRSQIAVEGITGRQITRFLLDCTDERYQQWRPGTHLHLHTVAHGRDHVGDVVFMDEYVGKRHIRMTGVVIEATPGARIVWQLRRGVRLPVHLTLELADRNGGVLVRHTITAGYRGIGRMLDPLLRHYFSPVLAAYLSAHRTMINGSALCAALAVTKRD